MDERIDDRLNEILNRVLARDLAQRYATGDELLYDLEHYIYHTGYGPTNETLGRYIRELFGQTVPSTPAAASSSAADSTARLYAKP
jgi:serine/threonine-protein kinase